jgi:hypothetical protein
MYRKADRHCAEGEAIADLSRSRRTAHDLRADCETGWSQYVSLLTVLILQESETS